MRQSTQQRALGSRLTHSFHIGLGYMEHTLILKRGTFKGSCVPPASAVDGSQHILKSPADTEHVMAWVARDLAWSHPAAKGHRMAFTGDHLASHGWSYVGPKQPAAT